MRRFVLITALSDYQIDEGRASINKEMELPGVASDRVRLREIFQDHTHLIGGVHRFNVLADDAARSANITSAIEDLAREANATDQVILYFAGHGACKRNAATKRMVYYFMPYDATFPAVEESGLSMDQLGRAIEKIKAQEIVVILDCCHSGGVAGGMVHGLWSDENRDEIFAGWQHVYVMPADYAYAAD